MQAGHCFGDMLFFNRKSQINTGSALGDQRDIDVTDRAEDTSGDPWRSAQAFANHADNGALFLNSNSAQFF